MRDRPTLEVVSSRFADLFGAADTNEKKIAIAQASQAAAAWEIAVQLRYLNELLHAKFISGQMEPTV